MTREEAIDVILRHMPVGSALMCDALDIAISALREQEERRWIPVTERMPLPEPPKGE